MSNSRPIPVRTITVGLPEEHYQKWKDLHRQAHMSQSAYLMWLIDRLDAGEFILLPSPSLRGMLDELKEDLLSDAKAAGEKGALQVLAAKGFIATPRG